VSKRKATQDAAGGDFLFLNVLIAFYFCHVSMQYYVNMLWLCDNNRSRRQWRKELAFPVEQEVLHGNHKGLVHKNSLIYK